MSLATAQSHVTLAGQGCLLVEESYRRKAQQPFNPRFSTGDPSYGDLSFWQFLTQKYWTGEGQEKFDVVSKYRQSAGMDMRDPHQPRLGHQIESLSLTAALPTPSGPVASGTAVLYDDFEAPGAILTSLWNAMVSTGGAAENFAQGVATIGGSTRARSGQNFVDNAGTGSAGACYVPARYASSPYDTGALSRVRNIGLLQDDNTMLATSEWRFVVYTETSAVNMIHAAFAFLYGAGGGYILEVYGSNMNRARLVKSSATILTADSQASDTVLKTFDGTGGTTAPTGGSATACYYKITRDSSGNFEVFEGASYSVMTSLGTVTDTTYTTPRYMCLWTAIRMNTSTHAFVTGASTWVDEVWAPSPGQADAGSTGKLVNYQNALYCCWYTAAAAFTQTTVKTGSLPSNQPTITHVNARDIAVWSRDQEPTAGKNTFLAMCRGQTFRVYNNVTQVYTGSTTLYGSMVIPISSTVIVVAGTTAENNGIPGFEVITFDAGAWTVASQKVVTLDGNVQGMVVSSGAIDSSGTLYLAMSDLSNTVGTIPSRLFLMTSADLLASKPTVSEAITLSDFVIRGLFDLNGSVYLHGSRIRGTSAYASVLKYPSTVMWESTLAKSLYPPTDAIKFNHGVMTTWKGLDHVLFLGMNDLALWDPVLQLDLDGNVREVASFQSKQFSYDSANVLAIAEWAGSFYLLNMRDGTIKRTNTTRGAVGANYSYLVLEHSQMGANTELIQKSLFSVILSLSEAMPVGESLSVLVNDTVVGTMGNSDGTRKEIVLTSELTASYFTIKLRWPQSSTWQGYLTQGPTARFVPTQFKKKAWAFGVRVTRNLRRIDGTREQSSPATILAALESAWQSNTPVTFVDLDGTSYTVLVTDIDIRIPLLNPMTGKTEYLVFLELLQV